MTKLKHTNCDSKAQIMTKLKNSNCDSKAQIMTKLKNSNCDKTQQFKLWWNSKSQIVTKLKISNCDETQKHKWLQNSKCDNSKIQIVTKLKKKILTKLKTSKGPVILRDHEVFWMKTIFGVKKWNFLCQYYSFWMPFQNLKVF